MTILRPSNFELATAEILYRLPDYPSILQTFVWQDFDIPPRFPRLKGFLDFWETNLEGKLFGVRVASSSLLTRGYRSVEFRGRVH